MLNLLKVRPEDAEFLYQVYAETRREELQVTGWDEATLDAFLRMQFEMQARSYAMQYPDAEHQLVLLDDVPVGRILTESTEQSMVLVDLSLLPPYRNNGIGTRLLLDLQGKAEAMRKKVRLHVLQNNPAQNLYTRLGFAVTGENVPYLVMEWQAQS